jgi:hypothetical protein
VRDSRTRSSVAPVASCTTVGVAVGPNGAVYADTNTGNTFTSVSALVEVKPSGKVLTLWKS